MLHFVEQTSWFGKVWRRQTFHSTVLADRLDGVDGIAEITGYRNHCGKLENIVVADIVL